MFTYIKAKNFKSLKDIEINLNETKTKTNKLIAIYGENGSGKTHIVELFKLLKKLLIVRDNENVINKFLREIWSEGISEPVPQRVSNSIKPLLNLDEYRLLNEKKATELEYGFKINGKEGTYSIKFSDEILEEKLYYMVDKQRGYLFEIKKEENKILKKLNTNIFMNQKYNEELQEVIEKYWGKYSFLSLLSSERSEKNKEYVYKNISKNIFEVIDEILSMNIDVNIYENEPLLQTILNSTSKKKKIRNIERGSIQREKVNEIKKYENVLNIFFTQAYADIKAVTYKMENRMGRIYYELYFDKMIGGEIKSIPSTLESDGTRRILHQFESLIGALQGETVIIDEIDNGIHDVLMKNIIMSIKDEITGQLIITTHNTLLLEVLPKEYIYILSTDYEGNKRINSIREYNVQRNNNARDLYFKGVFGGIPLTDYIDFEEIKYALEDSVNKENVNIEET